MDISRCLFPTERTLHSSSSCCRRACPIYMECESSDRRNVVRIISISFFFLFSPKFRFPTTYESLVVARNHFVPRPGQLLVHVWTGEASLYDDLSRANEWLLKITSFYLSWLFKWFWSNLRIRILLFVICESLFAGTQETIKLKLYLT